MNETLNSLIPKSQFYGLENTSWLFTGAESPPLKGVQAALEEYMVARRGGPAGREHNARIEASCKKNIAALLGGEAEQIALLSHSSEGICEIAFGLGLQAGDNVVVNELEFPSGILPWLSLKDAGVEVRVAPHKNRDFDIDGMMSLVDDRTRLVMTSHVSYLSGARLDYKALYARLRETNALLLLDSTQALGVVPVEMGHTDFVVCSSYKWLMAVHGTGILAVNPARTAKLAPRFIGWRSVSDMFSPHRFERYTLHDDARRFELGYPSYPTIHALNFSSGLLLQHDARLIEAHVHALDERLIAGLDKLGLELLTPREAARRAGNISWQVAHGEELADRLREDGVLLWGGDGRARASIHAFNDSDDIDALLEGLAKYRELCQ